MIPVCSQTFSNNLEYAVHKVPITGKLLQQPGPSAEPFLVPEEHTKLTAFWVSFLGWASLVAQRVNICLQSGKTVVRSLCQEDPLEKGMATHSSILVWRIPWTEKPGRLQSMGSQRVGHN